MGSAILQLILAVTLAASYAGPPAPLFVREYKAAAVQRNLTQEYEITAYTSDYRSTGKRPGDRDYGVTASGKKAIEGITAACPRELPFGTRVEIPALEWTYTCDDRGGAIKGGRLDVYMTSEKRAKQFGRQTLKVKISPPTSGRGAD
ncbi:3D domain-containing protein [Paenibacillus sp. SI8]|uniref:3D domain-containing protein n=1 Tax=unclassified Paenibacillus TaxID=185978 RepID=UPI003466D969